MRILCEVFGLFDKRGASGGGTPYIIKGACGLGAYKGAAERRLTGGRKYAPKGNGKDEKERKERAKGKKKERKGEKKMKGGSLTGGRKYAPKGNGKDEKEKKERAKGKRRREKAERMIKSNPKEDEKRMKGGRTSANATERLRHTSPKTTRLFSTTRMFGANTRFSAHSHNNLSFNALHQQARL